MRFDNLPTNWKLVQLGEICEINMGQSPPSSTYNYDQDGLPFFQGKTDFGFLYPTKRVWCNEPKKVVNQNDILLSVRAPVGPTNIAIEESCIGRGLCGLKYLLDENSKFIFYFFRSIENELSQLGTGSTFQAISKSQISNLKFPLPPLPEQHRIVAKLEELFTKLDVSVAELKKAKAQIKRYRQSVLKSAFEGKLTEEWRTKSVECRTETAEELLAKIKDERKKALGKKYKVSTERSRSELPPVDSTNLPQLPKGWIWTCLGDILTVSSGDGLTSSKMKSDGRYAVYGGNGISGYYDQYMFAEQQLIIGRVGAKCGVVHITEPNSWITDNALIVEFKNLDMKFMFYLIHVLNLNQHSVSTAQPVISGAKIYPIINPFPPFKEQQQIVSEIERHFSVADATEKIIDQSLKQAERLRQSILKDAFTGKLVQQDPNDPPASLLLEKIKEERAKLNKESKPQRRTSEPAEKLLERIKEERGKQQIKVSHSRGKRT